MKRLFLSAVVLAMVASCSKSEVYETPKANQIGFSALNDRVTTKAANDNNSSLRIFAAKDGATNAWYIADYIAYGASTSALAPAGGPYYWPTDDSSMSFFAYAPYEPSKGNVTESDVSYSKVALKYTVPAGAQEDFTVAKPQTIESSDYEKTGYVVDLVFKHMLSKVTVKVDLSESFGKNHYISDGSAKIETDTPFTATITALKNTITVDATSSPVAIAAENASDKLEYADKTSYYIAPQDFKGCSLKIKGVTIRDRATDSELFSGDLDMITFDGSELKTSAAAFQSGKHYIFTVTIDAASADLTEIKFTATSDVNWGNSDIEIGK